MRGTNIWSWVITLVLAAGLAPATLAFGAQTQNPGMQRPPRSAQQPPTAQQQPPGAQQMPPSMRQQPGPAKPHTYYGKIVKTKKGQYALLTDPKDGKGYFLSNQNEARKYNQQEVYVTAKLDPQTSTLHVITIKPAS